MKILRVKATHFKNCEDGYMIDLLAKSKKTAIDKEYELQEIAEGLFTFNTVVIAGKNASGKTSALELLDLAYDIIGTYRVKKGSFSYEGVELEIIFFHEGYVYKYETVLRDNPELDFVQFINQRIYRKKYSKTNIRSLYDFPPKSEIGEKELTKLPADTSLIFNVAEKQNLCSISLYEETERSSAYTFAFILLNMVDEKKTLPSILRIFDENIDDLEQLEGGNYRLSFLGEEKVLSGRELYSRLSRGTTKGIVLYSAMVVSLTRGIDLLVDEIENHFHTSLVEYMISLYKDKTVNKHNASLIFTTHYPSLLDDIGRQDNVFICESGKKLKIKSMYDGHKIRPELLKSKQYINNVFNTAVNYDELMNLKRALMS